MPPKVKVTQDQIIQAAMDIVRESGIDALNARALAKQLDCSIQPIFKNFETMGSLKQALLVEAQKIYD